MQLVQKTHDAMTGGVLQSSKMNIVLDAQAYQMMFSGIYSDKITAPVREVCTNALDGHVKAGKADVPFDVHLPTDFNLVFWVRDYGCSMSHQFMMTEYNQINHSTKRDDNTAVGAFGLGRISPLAYTSTFTVTCWLDGIENVYSVYIGSDGIPDVAHLASRPSNEKTGVRVSYPVKLEDVNKFRAAAQAVFYGFDLLPNIVNETYKQKRPQVILGGDGWRVVSNENSPLRIGYYAKQGCVIYPVDRHQLADMGMTVDRYLTLIVDFPLGEITPTRPREALIYDDHTVANIKRRFASAFTGISKNILGEIEAQPDYITACIKWRDFGAGRYDSSERAVYNIATKLANWKGHQLLFRIDLGNSSTGVAPGMYFGKDHNDFGQHLRTLTFRSSISSVTLGLEQAKDVKVYYELPGLKFGPARMRQVIKDTDGVSNTRILWMRPISKAFLEDAKTRLHFLEFTDLATIEPLKNEKIPSSVKAKAAVRLRVFTAMAHVPHGRTFNAEYEEIVPTSDTIFIEQDQSTFKFEARWQSSDTILQELSQLVSAEVIAEGTKVYCLGQLVEKRVKKLVPKPRLISDHVKGVLETKFGVSKLKIKETTYDLQKNLSSAEHLRKCGVELWGNLKTFVETYILPPEVEKLTGTQRQVISRFFPEVFEKDDSNEHTKLRNALFEEYPMVSLIIERCYDRSTIITHLAHYLPLINPTNLNK